MTVDDIKAVPAYRRLVEALILTTNALEVAKTPGAEYRVNDNRALLRELGEIQ